MQEIDVIRIPKKSNLMQQIAKPIHITEEDLQRSFTTKGDIITQVKFDNDANKQEQDTNNILSKFMSATSQQDNQSMSTSKQYYTLKYDQSDKKDSPIISQFKHKTQIEEQINAKAKIVLLFHKFKNLEIPSITRFKLNKLINFKQKTKNSTYGSQKTQIAKQKQENKQSIITNYQRTLNNNYTYSQDFPGQLTQNLDIQSKQGSADDNIQQLKLLKYEQELLEQIEKKKQLIQQQMQIQIQDHDLLVTKKELEQKQLNQLTKLNQMDFSHTEETQYEFQKTLQTMQQLALINNTQKNLQQSVKTQNRSISTKQKKKLTLQQQKELDDYEVEAHKIILQKDGGQIKKLVNQLQGKNKQILNNKNVQIITSNMESSKQFDDDSVSAQSQLDSQFENSIDNATSDSSEIDNIQELQTQQSVVISKPYDEVLITNKTQNKNGFFKTETETQEKVHQLGIQQIFYIETSKSKNSEEFHDIRIKSNDIKPNQHKVEIPEQSFHFNEIKMCMPTNVQQIDNNQSYSSNVNEIIVNMQNADIIQKHIPDSIGNDINLSYIQASPILSSQVQQIYQQKQRDVLQSSFLDDEMIDNNNYERVIELEHVQKKLHLVQNIKPQRDEMLELRKQEDDIIQSMIDLQLQNKAKQEQQLEVYVNIPNKEKETELTELRVKRNLKSNTKQPTTQEQVSTSVFELEKPAKQQQQNQSYNEQPVKLQYAQNIDELLNLFKEPNKSVDTEQYKVEIKDMMSTKNKENELFFDGIREKKTAQDIFERKVSKQINKNVLDQKQQNTQNLFDDQRPISILKADQVFTRSPKFQQQEQLRQKRVPQGKTYQQIQLERLEMLKQQEELLDRKLQEINEQRQNSANQAQIQVNSDQLLQNIQLKQKQLNLASNKQNYVQNTYPTTFQSDTRQDNVQHILVRKQATQNHTQITEQIEDPIQQRKKRQLVQNKTVDQLTQQVPTTIPISENEKLNIPEVNSIQSQAQQRLQQESEVNTIFLENLKQKKQDLLNYVSKVNQSNQSIEQQAASLRPVGVKPISRAQSPDYKITKESLQENHECDQELQLDAASSLQSFKQNLNQQSNLHNEDTLINKDIIVVDGFIRSKNANIKLKQLEQNQKKAQLKEERKQNSQNSYDPLTRKTQINSEDDFLIQQLRPQKRVIAGMSQEMQQEDLQQNQAPQVPSLSVTNNENDTLATNVVDNNAEDAEVIEQEPIAVEATE